MAEQSAEGVVPWAYEADHHSDHGGADVFHHIVAGDDRIAEVANERDARLILHAIAVLDRVESLAANVEANAAADRAKAEGPGLRLGEIDRLRVRAANYDRVADVLRRALTESTYPPESRAT